jgi:hypothetical protein
MRRAALLAVLLWGSATRAQEADSAAAPAVAADSAARAAPADSAIAKIFRPHPAFVPLGDFRLDWSVNVERMPFRSADDPMEPLGVATMGHLLRLFPAVRTREISQGPGAESFALDGSGSSSSALLLDGSTITVPGTSGPHSEEIMLSEVSEIDVLRGGAAALYGPEAASGAALAQTRFPRHEDLLARAFGEEGVDEYQRASFQASRKMGSRAAFFTTTESRRLAGFFPGTKDVDRQFAAGVRVDLPRSWQGEANFRRFEGDERSGGIEDTPIIPLETRITDAHMKLFHPWSESKGLLWETRYRTEKIENVDPALGRTLEVSAPTIRITSDLPKWKRIETVLRAEATHWRIEHEEDERIERFWRGGAALRWGGLFGESLRVTETVRADAEEGQGAALQARFESSWQWKRLALLGVVSRNERFPDREAVDNDKNEIHHTGLGALELRIRGARFSVEGVASRVKDLRPEPAFEEVRRRDPQTLAPIGTGELRSGTVAIVTDPFAVPGARIGHLTIRTSFTLLSAEIEETGERIPLRARRTWTGDGALERRFFTGELLLRLRGRLTHLGDRLNFEGEKVADAWVTDVLIEGEIGDAAFHARFHDLLERADELEPGYRLPGFSHMYGISWRFWG